MAAQLRRIPLIGSALLGALVVSCGGPPVYVVAPPAPAAAPAPAPASAPQGGLQEFPAPVQQAPPAQAPPIQVAPPAPVVVVPAPAAPAPAPLAPATRPPVPASGRPGGASSLVELSEATADGAAKTWIKQQTQFCAKAGYSSLEPGCVHIQKNYVDKNNDDQPLAGKHKNCNDGTVHVEPAASVDGKKYIKAGTKVTVEYECESADAKSGVQPRDLQSHSGNSGTGK